MSEEMRNHGWSTTSSVVTFGVLDTLTQDSQQSSDLSPYPYSPTQIEIFLSCERKWAFRYIERQEVPPGKGAALGTEIHRQLEEYVTHGAPLLYSSSDPLQAQAATVAETALDHLPEIPVGVPGGNPSLVTERKFEFIGLRHRFYGKKDLTDTRTGVVYDYKSTSDFKWAKSPDDLKTDIQAVIYGMDEMLFRHTQSVQMRWIYMRTKGKAKSRPVDVTLKWSETWPVFDVIGEVVDLIETRRSQFAKGEWKRALDLAPTPGTCDKFGGCPWRGVCNLGPRERIHAMANAGQSATEMLLARLKSQQTAATTPPNAVNPPEAAQAPAPQPPPTVQEVLNTGDSRAAGAVASIETPPAPVEPPKEAAKRIRKVKASSDATKGKNRIGTLYVNCVAYPSSGEKLFEHLYYLADEKIKATTFDGQNGEKYRVPEYRFVKFGTGPAVLVAAVQETLDEIGRQDELFVDSSTPEGNACLNYLLANADRVVRGTR